MYKTAKYNNRQAQLFKIVIQRSKEYVIYLAPIGLNNVNYIVLKQYKTILKHSTIDEIQHWHVHWQGILIHIYSKAYINMHIHRYVHCVHIYIMYVYTLFTQHIYKCIHKDIPGIYA